MIGLDKGETRVTPILVGPTDTGRCFQRDFIPTETRDSSRYQRECINFSLQLTTDASAPQG